MAYKHLAPLVIAVLLAACAAPTTRPTGANAAAILAEQQEQARLIVAAYKRDAERLYGVAYPVFRAATEICPNKVAPSLGLLDVDTLDTVPKELKEAAKVELGLTETVKLTYVHPESPAARAGVQPGDELVAINGKAIPPGKRGLRAYVKAIDGLERDQLVQLKVNRGAEQITLTVEPEMLPGVGINYDVFSDIVNAFADGTAIHVTRGLLRVMNSDDALRMVVAHELAHNCQGHIEARQRNASIGLLFDLAAAAYGVNTDGAFSKAGAQAYSQEFELEADYVGLYYLARADLNTSAAREAFRLLTVEGNAALTAAYGSSHPSNPERFVRLEAAEAEIQVKRERGLPLVPEKKGGNKAAD